MTRIYAAVISASFVAGTFAAQAADAPAPLPVKAKASAPAYRWIGLYFGGHVGYGGGGFGPGTNPAHNEAVVFSILGDRPSSAAIRSDTTSSFQQCRSRHRR